MALILRKKTISADFIKKLDAFPKVSKDYKQSSAVGGTFSLAIFCFLLYLIYMETLYFLEGNLRFKFEPDTSHDRQLQINIDVTVRSACENIGIDILDHGNESRVFQDNYILENTWWDLTPEQELHFQDAKRKNSYFREQYHAIHETLWKNNYYVDYSEMPLRNSTPIFQPNACRIHGSSSISKVRGVVVISVKEFFQRRVFVRNRRYNFTHRIVKFSFGNPSPGIVHPLQGIEKVTSQKRQNYQYFVEVIETDVNLRTHQSNSYQYSVRDIERIIDHNKGSHGVVGIFFKYDVNALKIHVTQEQDSIYRFLVKLCAIVGCIFVTNGLLIRMIQSLWRVISCNFSKTTESDKFTANVDSNNAVNLQK